MGIPTFVRRSQSGGNFFYREIEVTPFAGIKQAPQFWGNDTCRLSVVKFGAKNHIILLRNHNLVSHLDPLLSEGFVYTSPFCQGSRFFQNPAVGQHRVDGALDLILPDRLGEQVGNRVDFFHRLPCQLRWPPFIFIQGTALPDGNDIALFVVAPFGDEQGIIGISPQPAVGQVFFQIGIPRVIGQLQQAERMACILFGVQ